VVDLRGNRDRDGLASVLAGSDVRYAVAHKTLSGPGAGGHRGSFTGSSCYGANPAVGDRALRAGWHGWFDGAVEVVAGSWQNCGPDPDAILRERLGPLGIPILGGFDVGHGPASSPRVVSAPALRGSSGG
jgi:hypothetical protein